MLNTNKYEILTFDCYGTLIDWESSILDALRPVLSKYNVSLKDNQILEHYAKIEAKLEAGEYIRYREVLKKAVQQFGERFDFNPKNADEIVMRRRKSATGKA